MKKHFTSKKISHKVIRLVMAAMLSVFIAVPQSMVYEHAEEQGTTTEINTEGNSSEDEKNNTDVQEKQKNKLSIEEEGTENNGDSTVSIENQEEKDAQETETNDTSDSADDILEEENKSGANEESETDLAKVLTENQNDISSTDPTGAETSLESESKENSNENTPIADLSNTAVSIVTAQSESSNADTVYVDGMNGDDAIADGSKEHPYKTLSAASSALSSSGTILVMGTITADSGTLDDLKGLSSKNISIHRTNEFSGTVLSIPSDVSVNIENIEINGDSVEASSALISVESGGALTIGEGALLTGNNNTDPDGRGGAIYNSGTLVLEGGTITGNTSAEGAGIYNAGSFSMKGGSISSNTADNPKSSYYAAGGGLFCATNSNTELYSGTISGNTSINGGSLSGGGIYIDDGATVAARDLLVKDNNADFEGGGISACPTGRIDFRYSNSAAVFDNSSKTDADDLHFEVVENSIVKNGMLGGGNESWDPAPKSGETGEAYYNAHPSESDKEQASNSAKMIISDNHAEEGMGGGIRCNGTLTITASDPRNDTDSGEDNSGTKTFIKQSSDGTRLQGATYEIYDSEGLLTASVTSDDNGILDFNDISDGTYSVKEISAPYGYAVSSETYTMEIKGNNVCVKNADGDSLSAFIDGKADGIGITLDKVGKEWLDSYAQQNNLDNPAAPLSNVQFTLTGKTDSGAEKTIVGTTGSDGTLDFGFIPDGTWTLTEAYPDGYSSRAGSNSSYTFTVKNGKFEQGETSESYVSGGKTYTENNLGIDIVFGSDEDGNESFNVTNYRTHEGRQGPPGPRNQYFKKDFETKQVISGAVYAQCDSEGNIIEGTEFTIAGSGTIKPTAGSYYREVTPPDGYLLDPSIYQVVGGEGHPGTVGIGVPGQTGRTGPAQQLLNITTGELSWNAFLDIRANSFGIIKKDADDGSVLEGVSFLLSNAETSIKETTDSNGVAMFYDVPDGTYTLTETESLESYCHPEGNWEVTVSGSNITVLDKNGEQLASGNNGNYGLPEYTIENTKIKETPIKIKKISAETGKRIEGAVFHISADGKDNDNNTVSFEEDYQTDDSGYIALNAPYNGTLTIREIANPGYSFENQSYTVTTVNGNIDTIQSSSGLYSRKGNEIIIQNELARTFNIRKVDSLTGNVIYDKKVTFYAYGEDSATETKFSQRVTSDNGTVSFAITDNGTYYLREIEAPDGYILDEERFKITVKDGIYTLTDSNGKEIDPGIDDNGVTVYEIANTPITNSVQIYKIDTESRKPLGGAQISLTGTSNNGIEYSLSATTDEKGVASFDGICSGTFTLHEEKAPDGYGTCEDITFTLSDDGSILINGEAIHNNAITITDEKLKGDKNTSGNDGNHSNEKSTSGTTSSNTSVNNASNKKTVNSSIPNTEDDFDMLKYITQFIVSGLVAVAAAKFVFEGSDCK